jgi:hypothetical protein
MSAWIVVAVYVVAIFGWSLYDAERRASRADAGRATAERERDEARAALLNSALDRIRAAAIGDTVQVHVVVVSEEIAQ